MAEDISIKQYPVFEKGIFENHPALFDPYFHNHPDHQKKKYRKAKKNLPKYEENYTWQVITGPGFCGSIHSGTGKIFHGVMTDATHPVYNSDCMYINLPQRLFAISDPPGITTLSRDLIIQLDRLLQTESDANLEALINEVNRNAGTGVRDRATLTLVHFPSGNPGKALALLSGDSYLFQGNVINQQISRLEASPNRWGTPNAYFEMQEVDIKEGDFFVLASDGISAIRPRSNNLNLDETILKMATSDSRNFAFNIARNSNEIIEEAIAGKTRTVFGGGDDVSVILIEPEKLQPAPAQQSYILGGYIL
ncbi:MAG: hypothetical protein R6U37_01125 [Dehalococcoidia bacterium]